MGEDFDPFKPSVLRSTVTALLWCFDNRADLRSSLPPGEAPRYWVEFGQGKNRRRTRDHGCPRTALEEAMNFNPLVSRKELTDNEQS
jgi:hypothetical protein